jgi:hypothetical protein
MPPAAPKSSTSLPQQIMVAKATQNPPKIVVSTLTGGMPMAGE